MISSRSHGMASRPLSLREAAVIASTSPKAIRHLLEARILGEEDSGGERERRRFCVHDALFFSLLSGLPFALSNADKRSLYTVLTGHGTASDDWRLEGESVVRAGRVEARFALSELKRSILHRLRLWRRGRRRVVTHPEILGGEPVFEGTRLSVFHVGELVKKGTPLAELREDFPRLNEEDFEIAAIYHELGRPPGRPRKQLELRRGFDEPADRREPVAHTRPEARR